MRDNGVTGSLEARVPVWRRADETPILELAAFVDAGYSWNNSREGIDTVDPERLLSVGLGARWLLTNHLRAEIYWGHRIDDVVYAGPWNLQDDGLHVQISLAFP